MVTKAKKKVFKMRFFFNMNNVIIKENRKNLVDFWKLRKKTQSFTYLNQCCDKNKSDYYG